jgi:hypothetical protein
MNVLFRKMDKKSILKKSSLFLNADILSQQIADFFYANFYYAYIGDITVRRCHIR